VPEGEGEGERRRGRGFVVREGEMVVRRLARADGSPQQGGKAANGSSREPALLAQAGRSTSWTEGDAQGQTRSSPLDQRSGTEARC
jgi:hypothetical protein